MKKTMMKLGNFVAGVALIVATLNVNSTCCHYVYQESMPDSAYKLRK
ncbi:cyclic lactone autoinducer peptide [Anaerovorax odorimutans]|uniref:Cyclic lactone autoinducer peptide n=1 Tax=Anaerovorax odorimutans TaxID=109327 RepID=A0ABT1RTM5_9FIRM|nr:cyclic lactone autoinducer peptide [Anaerovorax odorimutans]MCQ4638515.1 cyclic lactone autoinducer peptide [Anaerovorax odorimutans]